MLKRTVPSLVRKTFLKHPVEKTSPPRLLRRYLLSRHRRQLLHTMFCDPNIFASLGLRISANNFSIYYFFYFNLKDSKYIIYYDEFHDNNVLCGSMIVEFPTIVPPHCHFVILPSKLFECKLNDVPLPKYLFLLIEQ